MKTVFLFTALFFSPLAFADCPYIDMDSDIETLQFETGNETGDYLVTYTFPDLKQIDCSKEEGALIFDLNENPVRITYKKGGVVTQQDRILSLTMRIDGFIGLELASEKRVANIHVYYEKISHQLYSYFAFVPFHNFQLQLRENKE